MASKLECTLSNGRKATFLIEKATVIDQSETTTSETFSGRPKLTVLGGNVIPTAGAIETELVTTSKVWLLKEDQTEEQVDTSEFSVPVRVGHQISLAREVFDGQQGAYVGMYNFKTKKSSTNFDFSLKGQRKYGGGRPKGTGWKMVVIGPIVIGILAGLLGWNSAAGFGIGMLCVPLGIVLLLATNFIYFDRRQAVVLEARQKVIDALAAA